MPPGITPYTPGIYSFDTGSETKPPDLEGQEESDYANDYTAGYHQMRNLFGALVNDIQPEEAAVENR